MVTQGKVIRSEWIKLRSVRSSWLMLGATVLGIAGVGLLVAYAAKAHWSASSATDFNPVNQTLIGVNLAELTIGVLGVLVASGEYATGMIRATFTAVPRRLPVLVAKAGVLAAVTFAVCLAAVLIAFVGGQALLGPHGLGIGHPETAQAVLGATLYLTGVSVLGVALGFLIRSIAGGIATVIGVLFVLVGAGNPVVLMRPGRIRGSGRRAGPAAEPGHQPLGLARAQVRRADSGGVPGAAGRCCNGRGTRSGPAAGAVRR